MSADEEPKTAMQRAREALQEHITPYLLAEADRCAKCRTKARQHTNPYCEECALEEGAL